MHTKTLVRNRILGHLRQTINTYKTRKLRILGALRTLSVALLMYCIKT